MNKQYRHKKLGYVAKYIDETIYGCGTSLDIPYKGYIYDTNSSEFKMIDRELLENSDDREPIKEVEFLPNGICIYKSPSIPGDNLYQHTILFDTKENADKREKKMDAYKNIMKRIYEKQGDWKPSVIDIYIYNIGLNTNEVCVYINSYQKISFNEFTLKEAYDIPPEIEQELITYFTS